MRRYWLQLLGISGFVLLADQASKMLVTARLQPGQSLSPLPALEPFFRFTYSQNRGAAFGILPVAADIFLLVAIVFVLALLWYYPRLAAAGPRARLASGLIGGGALGNAVDRLQHGHVVDFIHYQIPGLVSNVSNLADHAIVLGAILLLLDSWLPARRGQRSRPVDKGSQA